MSASTGTIPGSAQRSIIRPLLLAVAGVVASLAIIGGGLLASAKPTVAPVAPATIVHVPQPGAAVHPSSVRAGATKAGNEPVVSRGRGPRVQ